jgi:hypothetical protein
VVHSNQSLVYSSGILATRFVAKASEAMRRRVVVAAIGILLMLVLLCGAGAARAWSTQGYNLIVPGASDIEIERHGLFRLHVTYRLPSNQKVHNVTEYFARQGWRRLRLTNVDRSTLSFVRGGDGQIREILIVTLGMGAVRTADIEFSRCYRFYSWVNCV